MFIIMLPLALPAQDTEAVTTFYFIRHAEKKKSKDYDPELTEKGAARAVQWAAILRDVPLAAVYSTGYVRTRETTFPTAVDHDLTVTIYKTETIDMNTLIELYKGKSLLIVGHSNSVPRMVNGLLGKEKYPDIEHNNNGNLYIVTIAGDDVSSILLHFD